MTRRDRARAVEAAWQTYIDRIDTLPASDVAVTALDEYDRDRGIVRTTEDTIVALTRRADAAERRLVEMRAAVVAVLHDGSLTWSTVTEEGGVMSVGPMMSDSDAIAAAVGVDRATGKPLPDAEVLATVTANLAAVARPREDATPPYEGTAPPLTREMLQAAWDRPERPTTYAVPPGALDPDCGACGHVKHAHHDLPEVPIKCARFSCTCTGWTTTVAADLADEPNLRAAVDRMVNRARTEGI